VVLALESVSTYHSKMVSGLWDAMPKMDHLAERGTWFSNFYANGFHTNGGLIALFGGRVPSPSIHRYSSLDAYTGFEKPELDFYAELARLGYDSEFFTTGTLAFQGRGQWLETMGFDGRHGADEHYYDGMRRWQFDAAEDSALVARFMQWYDEREHLKPLFAAVLTVTSHPPFIDPRSGKQDELGTFRYVDEQAAAFYAALEQRKFFEHGILLVLGDHRSMTPIKPGEYERYGDSAYARVPAWVFGQSGLPAGRIDQPFQQTDLIPSVLRLVGGESCRTPAQGTFLGGAPASPRYILHSGGLHRDRIDVFFDNRQGTIILDGDDTRWLGPKPPDADALIAGVNRDRASRAPLQEDLLDYFIQIFANQAAQKPARDQ
jgi:phosphoglycerol transferase MdoB-like AlkP superfamily enzyme